jgi:hypothetical protein
MRLIDVDELIEYFDEDLEGYDNREYILHMLDSKGRSARVEAIPVELIYKIRNLYLKNDCIISAGVCNEILNMWGKENEAD